MCTARLIREPCADRLLRDDMEAQDVAVAAVLENRIDTEESAAPMPEP